MKKLIFLLLVVPSFVLAQFGTDNTILPSPNTAGLVYGNQSVSLYDGRVDVSIPIREVDLKGIKLPISLNYNTSGVNPSIPAGWVGLNWSLAAGGCISRIVRKMPDETDNLAFSKKGFFYSYNQLNSSTWDSNQSFSSYITTSFEDNFFNGYRVPDTEPDEFHFNFLGYQGKFYFDQTRKIRVQCEKHLRVEFDTADLFYPFLYYNTTPSTRTDWINKTFNKFTIIDDRGNKYLFGTEECIEYCDNASGWVNVTDFPYTKARGAFFIPSSWYLKRITSKDDIELASFSYKRGPFISAISGSFNRDSTKLPGSSSVAVMFPLSTKIISPVYINKIDCPLSNVQIQFNSSKCSQLRYPDTSISYVDYHPNDDQISEYVDILNITNGIYFFNESIPPATSKSNKLRRLMWIKLDGITFKSYSDNKTYNSIELVYNNNPNERLLLKEVLFRSSNASKYQMIYNSKMPPDYFSVNDAAGYYNGTRWPGGSVSLNYNPNIDSFKQCILDSAKCQILERLIYPSGGSSSYEYELNDYNKYVNDTRTGIFNIAKGYISGLRIKKIIDSSFSSPPIVRRFYYCTDYNNSTNISSLASSGVLKTLPKYTFGPTSGVTTFGTEFTYTFKGSNPILPFSGSDNELKVTYSEVTEKRGDGSYTKYYFTNHDNNHADAPPSNQINAYSFFFLSATSKEMERGKTYKIKYYRSDDSLIKETKMDFSIVGKPSTEYIKTLLSVAQQLNSNPYAFIVAGAANKIYYYNYFPTKITDTEFKDGLRIVNEHNYTYDSIYKTLTSDKYINSKGDTIKIEYRYPFYFVGQAIYDTMTARNRVEFVVEKLNYKNSIFLKSEKTNFQNWGNNLIAPVTMESKTRTLASEVRQRVLGYDSMGNMLSFSKESDTKTSYIWDYNKIFLIAECINADTSSIAYSSFETNGKGNWKFNGSPTVDVFALTGKKVYNLMGNNDITRSGLDSGKVYIISYWSKNSTAFSIAGTQPGYPMQGDSLRSWHYFEHRVTGKTQITINGTGSIDEICLHPEGSQMTTYTYDPFLGVTSHTDIKRKITYYQYDGFGRLVLIRDQDNKILKKICYNYQGQPENCIYFGNEEKSAFFTRANCTGDSTGHDTIYIVPADTYFASTQLTADSLALADINQNGQAFANKNGTCSLENLTLFYNNFYDFYTFSLTFTNLVTSQVYEFNTGSSSYGVLGKLPPGQYDVEIYSDCPYYATYWVGCSDFKYGVGLVYIYNVLIGSDCNFITIFNY